MWLAFVNYGQWKLTYRWEVRTVVHLEAEGAE